MSFFNDFFHLFQYLKKKKAADEDHFLVQYYLFGKRYLSGRAHKVWDVKMNIHKVDYRKFGDMYFC